MLHKTLLFSERGYLLATVCDWFFKGLDWLLEHELQPQLSFFSFFFPCLDQFSGLGSQHNVSDNSVIAAESWTFSGTEQEGAKGHRRGNSAHSLAWLLQYQRCSRASLWCHIFPVAQMFWPNSLGTQPRQLATSAWGFVGVREQLEERGWPKCNLLYLLLQMKRPPAEAEAEGVNTVSWSCTFCCF